MELYEIVKYKEEKNTQHLGVFKEQVLTVVTDRKLAEKMLEIYQSNQREDEAYKIITVQKSEAKPFTYRYTPCSSCNSYAKCVNFIKTRPDVMIRCIGFGALRDYINKKENNNDYKDL